MSGLAKCRGAPPPSHLKRFGRGAGQLPEHFFARAFGVLDAYFDARFGAFKHYCAFLLAFLCVEELLLHDAFDFAAFRLLEDDQ